MDHYTGTVLRKNFKKIFDKLNIYELYLIKASVLFYMYSTHFSGPCILKFLDSLPGWLANNFILSIQVSWHNIRFIPLHYYYHFGT